MKIYIIGHRNRIDKIKRVISLYYKNITFDVLDYSCLSEAEKVCDILKKRQLEFDALLFTGEVPFQKINSYMIPLVTCDFISKDKVSLLLILLKIMKNKNFDITKISFDTYNENLIKKIYEEIGFSLNDISLKFTNVKINEEKCMEKIFEFHLENYKNNNVSCCITALNNIYEMLKAEAIPCYILDPSTNVIKQSIERLMLKNIAKINEKTKIVVVSIYIDYPHDYSITNCNEYQSFLIRTKVSERIYAFIQRLQAAVVQESSNQFILFCTKASLESETDNYRSIELLHNISKDYASNISIGIGHGITAREAKYNAVLGMNKAKAHGKNTAYVIYEGEEIIGPIIQSEVEENNQIIRDEKYYDISLETGISINKLFSLHSMIQKYKKDTFTSKDISNELKLSIRSINKIINKLEDANFIEIIGKKFDGKSGRPSRLIKILF